MIKFMAWNQIDSEYINEINAVMSLDGSHIWWDINDSGEMKYDDDPGDYKLEQFTGLTDVNGKDIYEGDLVRLADDLDNPYKVIFDKAKFEFSGSRFCYDFGEAFMDYEVIGNVHTNPELLEEDE